MQELLRSLFSGLYKSARSLSVSGIEDLQGHTFEYHDYETANLYYVARVEKLSDSEFEVFSTRHTPSGVHTSSWIVDRRSIVLRNGIKCDGDFAGQADGLWLPPAFRQAGARVQFAGYPMSMMVLGEAMWKETRTWVLKYDIFGQPAWKHYNATNGVLIGQTGKGFLATTSLPMALPKI